MATINAVFTEDFKRNYLKFLGGGSGYGVSESTNSYTTSGNSTQTVLLSALAAGDIFYSGGKLKRLLSIPSAAGSLAGGSKWVENIATGVVTQVDQNTKVVRQRNLTLMQAIKSFKIGGGGWIDLGASKVPRTPDATLRRLEPHAPIQDLDAIVDYDRTIYDPSRVRYAAADRVTYEKDLTVSDFTAINPSTLQIKCELTAGEFGGHSLWEIGIFGEILDPSLASIVATTGVQTYFTFVNSNPDTITRTSGSFIDDGFVAGLPISVSGSASNDGVYTLAVVAPQTMTLINSDTLAPEAPGASVTITGEGGTNHRLMIAYGTFPEQTNAAQIDNYVNLTIG